MGSQGRGLYTYLFWGPLDAVLGVLLASLGVLGGRSFSGGVCANFKLAVLIERRCLIIAHLRSGAILSDGVVGVRPLLYLLRESSPHLRDRGQALRLLVGWLAHKPLEVDMGLLRGYARLRQDGSDLAFVRFVLSGGHGDE